MLTKFTYVGGSVEDFIDIYILYIRSLTEYCSVAFHSSLTVEQSNRIERIQKTCLKVILNDMYINYQAALEMTGLQTLFDRRGQRCLQFSLRAIKHDRNSKLFPLNKTAGILNTRQSEKFTVNFASTSSYRDSAIPFCQRLLNNHFKYKWCLKLCSNALNYDHFLIYHGNNKSLLLFIYYLLTLFPMGDPVKMNFNIWFFLTFPKNVLCLNK